jgi:serine/threonine-protein kinase ULK/ATG1
LTNTAIRLIGTSAHSAATALVRATAKRRPTILRTTEVDKDEDDLLRQVEDLARKAFVLFELADNRLVQWQHLGTAAGSHPYASGGTPPFASSRRKSSSSSANSELMVLRQQEAAAGEAVHLYIKAMAFMTVGTQSIKSFVDNSRGYSDDCLSLHDISPSPELVQSKLRNVDGRLKLTNFQSLIGFVNDSMNASKRLNGQKSDVRMSCLSSSESFTTRLGNM